MRARMATENPDSDLFDKTLVKAVGLGFLRKVVRAAGDRLAAR